MAQHKLTTLKKDNICGIAAPLDGVSDSRWEPVVLSGEPSLEGLACGSDGYDVLHPLDSGKNASNFLLMW